MEITHDESGHAFETEIDGINSHLVYEIQGEGADRKMLFTHTFVAPEHRGKGVAAALVKYGLAYAREHKYEIVPVCSYVVAYLERHPEEG